MADFENTETEQPEVAPADDVRSQLVAALAEQEAPPEPAPKVARTPEADEAPAEKTTGERARGPDGKFVAQEPAAEDAPKPEAKAAEPIEPKPATAEDPIAKATAKWSEADRAMLKALPQPAQDFVMRRTREMDADYTRKTQELSREKQQLAAFQQEYAPIHQMFAPHAEIMRQKGLTPASTIQAWHNVEMQLLQGGPTALSVVKGIVNGYKIDPAQLASALGLRAASPEGALPAPEGQQPPAALPPEFVNKLTSMEQWIAAQEHATRVRAQQEHQTAATRVMTEIEQFSSAVDNAGVALHPHFSEVENQMAVLAELARASGRSIPPLSELYEQAVWANPSTRQSMLDERNAAAEAQRAADEKKRHEEVRAKAAASRRAGASVSGAPGSTSQAAAGRPNGTGSVREALLAAAEEHADAA